MSTLYQIGVQYIYKNDPKNLREGERQISDFANKAKRILGAIGIAMSFRELNQIVEQFTEINNQINAATRGLQDQLTVYRQILDTANKTRTAYGTTAGIVTGLMNTFNKTFSDVDNATEFAEIIAKVGKGAGLAEGEVASLGSSITSAFTTGKVSAGLFNTMMSKTPQVIDYLTEDLQVSTETIKAWGMSGMLTADQLYKTLTKHGKDIDEMFNGLDYTISDAIKDVKNNFGLYITELDDALGVTSGIAEGIKTFSNGLKGFMSLLTQGTQKLSAFLKENSAMAVALKVAIGTLATVIGSNLLKNILQLDKVVKGLQFMKSIMMLNPKILLIAAALTTVLVLLNQFMKFMRGDESIFDKWFEKGNVDAEEFRENLRNILELVTKLFSLGVKVIGTILRPILDAFGEIDVVMGKITRRVNNMLSIIQPLVDAMKFLVDKYGEIYDFIGSDISLSATTSQTVKTLNTYGGSDRAGSKTSTVINNINNTTTFNGDVSKNAEKAADKITEAEDSVQKSLASALLYNL